MNMGNHHHYTIPYVKDQISRSIAASDHAESIISIIGQAFQHARSPRNVLTQRTEIPRLENIPYRPEILIAGSSLDRDGNVVIPGLLWMIDSLCLSLQQMIQIFNDESPYAKPDLFNRTKDYIFSYRDPDTITNDTTLSTISSPDPSHPHSMQGLIREIRQSLVYIEKSIRYERVGGVDCYQIEPEDRYLIRSFMLSIHAIYPSGHKYTPKISISRTGEALLIRFVPAEKNRPSFLLQVTGLVGTVCLEGGKATNITKCQSHFGKYLMVWREKKKQSRSTFRELPLNTTGISSTFHARSYDELMQFLTYTSHQMAICKGYPAGLEKKNGT